ncbi:hypothetical protein M5K25_004252 [Dendrobium thyrsiflorum]|uniref:Uncharacterized protein n=1 Tax=Dendrobium thyrsiflorum TaxID=117978 RepID=A0ABD0VM28_DENTH
MLLCCNCLKEDGNTLLMIEMIRCKMFRKQLSSIYLQPVMRLAQESGPTVSFILFNKTNNFSAHLVYSSHFL